MRTTQRSTNCVRDKSKVLTNQPERTRVDACILQLSQGSPCEPTVRFSPSLSFPLLHTLDRRRILAYLIALRILRGHLPTPELLFRFPLLAEMYTPFIDAIRKGDVRAYDSALERWSGRLIEAGLWVVLEKGRDSCLRGLFRKVSVVLCYPSRWNQVRSTLTLRWVTFSKPTRLPVPALHSALHLSGVPASLDEAECLVAGMIYKGYVRGYISHEKRTVVLASVNAFPRVCERGPGVWAEL